LSEKEKVLKQWDLLNRIAVNRFGETVLAEEAALYILEKLGEDDWRRVKAYNGKARFRTYIAALAVRLVEDFARRRFGRVRPPAWLNQLGSLWKRMFALLCLERVPPGDAIEILRQSRPSVPEKEVETVAYELLGRIPDCGTSQGDAEFEEENDYSDGLSRVAQPLPPDRLVEKKEIEIFFDLLFKTILQRGKSDVTVGTMESFKALDIRLSADERLLLRLCFQEGKGVTEAGRILGLNRFQAHGRMRRLMVRLKGELERVGLGRELRNILR